MALFFDLSIIFEFKCLNNKNTTFVPLFYFEKNPEK